MTDTTDISADAGTAAPRRTGSLSALRLPQLQALAAELGISGTGRMRKVDLLAAIRDHQAGVPSRPAAPAAAAPVDTAPADAAPVTGTDAPTEAPARRPRRASAPVGAPAAEVPAQRSEDGQASAAEATAQPAAQPATPPAEESPAPAPVAEETAASDASTPTIPTLDDFTKARVDRPERGERPDRSERPSRRERARRERVREPDQQVELPSMPVREPQQRDGAEGAAEGRAPRQDRSERGEGQRERGDNQRTDRNEQRNDRSDQRGDQRNEQRGNDQRNDRGPRHDDDEDGGRRGRRNRYRDRKGRRGPGGGAPEIDEQINDDDVLLPVAGILDVLDNYAFIRTSGYLAGQNDVYVSLGQVKKNHLRPGDAVTGAVRQPREGEQSNQRQKFNALVRVDTVNGAPADQARNRPDFTKLTPLYPQERLRLETEPNVLTTRIIDLMSPLGKGQRGLIVAPPKAGKTMVMQAIANAITTNNPECHLMVVLVDERPEEVTDMQRTIKGEVIASTFDRPAADHTAVAELAIERAKRLVELGNDVVVLLDSLTRLSRAYNISAPASGRILSGGVDASALYPPKRFFGAARNVENGGSLTILASALVETGSKADEVIFEEFKGTGNMEVRLSRQLADKRIFPAVDVPASGTRREEILMSREELQTVWKLRRVVTALDAQAAIELLLDRLKKTRSNLEFLVQVQKSTPLVNKDGDD
ncbi:transcription termination factor Rho [Kineococcus gynurae]|uniref:Transcription termination factor Rho n=1 Tax=Kineococcus gynurae TaxID=452979 RepID=A0ABV5LMX0_9ACTN